MKAIILLASFVAVSAQANMTCSYAGVEVATLSGVSAMTVMNLSDEEEVTLVDAIDSELNCDEGVELASVELVEGNAVMNVVCYADSLGAMATTVALSCK